MEVKISVILPAYNAEKYIAKTIESLLEQTIKDFEIICINDGSKDNTLKLLNSYAKNDKRLVIIDKKNEGVWKARFDGIKQARGKYITFIDSDDYVNNDFLEKLYKNITKNNSDIAICGFQRIDFETKKIISREMKYSEDRIIDMKKNPEEVISINTALWNKMYRAELLKGLENLKNPPRILEDMMFLAMLYLNVQKITFVDEILYNYMVIQGSAMNTLKKEEIENIQQAMLEVQEKYNRANAAKERKEILADMAFLHFGISLMLKASENESMNFKEIYLNNLRYLDTNFKQWRKSKYLKLGYSLKKGSSNFKVAIVKKIYIFHCFRFFISLYKLITKTLKIDIKW